MINQTENHTAVYTKGVKKLIKSIVMSYVLTLIILMIISILITYTNLSESIAGVAVVCATYVSTAACGFFAASNTSKKGWLTGSIAGLVYIFILLVISIIKGNFTFGAGTATSIIISILTGALGGVVGINTKRE